MIEALILLIVLLVVVIWIYSLLIKDRNQVLAAWSDIDVQLKRRHDLIPQLVTAVKIWAEQFTEIFANLEAKTGQNYHPLWYAGVFHSHNIGSFATEVDRSFNSAISATTSAPGSTSGGGEFSGGGW